MRKYSKNELEIIGAAFYSCEGTRLRRDKRWKNEVYHWVIEFTNSNFKIIRIFVEFLRKIIKIDESRLKGELFVYDDTNKRELEKFWSKTTGIPLENFNKTILLKAKNSRYKPNPNGTFKIRYHSKEAYQRLDLLVRGILE